MTLYRSIVALLNAITRLLNAHANRMEAPVPKQEVDVLPRRTPEEDELLDTARAFPHLWGKLPKEYREVLEKEREEMAGMPD